MGRAGGRAGHLANFLERQCSPEPRDHGFPALVVDLLEGLCGRRRIQAVARRWLEPISRLSGVMAFMVPSSSLRPPLHQRRIPHHAIQPGRRPLRLLRLFNQTDERPLHHIGRIVTPVSGEQLQRRRVRFNQGCQFVRVQSKWPTGGRSSNLRCRSPAGVPEKSGSGGISCDGCGRTGVAAL